jgi:hypothetical protein
MIEADELLSVLAIIGEDGCSAERRQQIGSQFPGATFWANERSVQQIWSSTDSDVRTVGRGLRELLLNSSCKMELATLYFHMLASKDAPVRILALNCLLTDSMLVPPSMQLVQAEMSFPG